MPWVISFIISWILFLILIDWKKLKINIIGGVLSLALASFLDWGAQKLNMYEFTDLIIPWFGCSAFYKFGPIFVMGILFVQNVPQNKWLQLVNVFICTLLFLSLELLIVNTGVAKYLHWHYLASSLVDIFTFSSLTWLTTTFLRKSPV